MKKAALVIALVVLIGFALSTYAVFAQGKPVAKPATMPWSADTKFVALKADKTKMYHSVTDPACSKKLATMKKDDMVCFQSKEDAEKAGYKLCAAEGKPVAKPAKMPWTADIKFAALKADKNKFFHSLTDGECVKKLEKMVKDDMMFFKTKEEAIKAGFKACEGCCKAPVKK